MLGLLILTPDGPVLHALRRDNDWPGDHNVHVNGYLPELTPATAQTIVAIGGCRCHGVVDLTLEEVWTYFKGSEGNPYGIDVAI